MSKFLKKLMFFIFIVAAIMAIGYLGVLTYIDANCSRGIKYFIEKYDVDSTTIRTLKYQEYVYEDIANCDSLWIKKCTSDENLLYEYTIKIEDTEIVIKELKGGIFTDNYEKGTIRKEYQEKIDKENQAKQDTENESN